MPSRRRAGDEGQRNLRTDTDILKQTAFELGFELVAVVRVGEVTGFDAFCRWIAAGYHAGMDYLSKNPEARRNMNSVLPGVRSVLMLGVSYEKVLESENHSVKNLSGIAEYARGIDYHDWIRRRLKTLSVKHRELFSCGKCRGAVDTAPILERSLAVDAGFGRIGKNTLLLTKEFGSKLFLAELLSTELLEPNRFEPKPDPCGDCHICLNACPTGALIEPFVLDARRCLNYWTIEHHGSMPEEIREKIGDRFFGCDTCQSICPWNRSRSEISSGDTDPRSLDEAVLRKIAAGSPLERRFR